MDRRGRASLGCGRTRGIGVRRGRPPGRGLAERERVAPRPNVHAGGGRIMSTTTTIWTTRKQVLALTLVSSVPLLVSCGADIETPEVDRTIAALSPTIHWTVATAGGPFAFS